MSNNIIEQTDSYKFGGHFNMYPDGTEYVYSYFESRKGARFPVTPFFGLQYILKEYFVGQQITKEKIDLAEEIAAAHFGSKSFFHRKGWEQILNKHGGMLPLRIRAVPEGLPVPTDNVLMDVINTQSGAGFLTNYVESVLTHTWYPSTVAALSYATKKMIESYWDATADHKNGLDFALHDFGYRGVSSDESAKIGGAAHLLNFLGTDTVPAISFLMKYYGANVGSIGYSVAATEHSIMTARCEAGEADVLDDILLKYPKGILSIVSDSYDIYNFVDNFVGKRFRQRILDRDGVFVVRPDSITPLHPTPEAETVWIAQSLANNFGYTVNSKGFMVLNPKVRIIWGDGIDYDGIEKILVALKNAKFSAENIVFGMGGGLLQKVNRDTQRFAFKSSAQCRNGNWFDIYKKPKDLSKASKKGMLSLICEEENYKTVNQTYTNGVWVPHKNDILEVVFENGELKRNLTLAECRVLCK